MDISPSSVGCGKFAVARDPWSPSLLSPVAHLRAPKLPFSPMSYFPFNFKTYFRELLKSSIICTRTCAFVVSAAQPQFPVGVIPHLIQESQGRMRWGRSAGDRFSALPLPGMPSSGRNLEAVCSGHGAAGGRSVPSDRADGNPAVLRTLPHTERVALLISRFLFKSSFSELGAFVWARFSRGLFCSCFAYRASGTLLFFTKMINPCFST